MMMTMMTDDDVLNTKAPMLRNITAEEGQKSW